MATALHNLSEYDSNSIPDASNMCFGIVVSEWNPEVTGALLDGAVKTLEKHGAIPENIHVKTVPGSFELVYGAHQMTLNGATTPLSYSEASSEERPHTSTTSVRESPTASHASTQRAKFQSSTAC